LTIASTRIAFNHPGRTRKRGREGGREATVESTVVQECVSRIDGSVIMMTVQEKATLRIENGRLVIARLAATVKDVSVERGEAGEGDNQPR